MEVLATDTEQLIKDTAKKVFFSEGRLHATTQEIADEAGINRASIHYYFRSRKQLFDKVFDEAVTEMHSKMDLIFQEDLPFRIKTERFIDFFMKKSLEHPYLELFIITEFNTNPVLHLSVARPIDTDKRVELQKGIDAEIAANTMNPITLNHYVITLMSLCSFPFLGKSIIKNALSLTDNDYNNLIAERKNVIMKMLFLDL